MTLSCWNSGVNEKDKQNGINGYYIGARSELPNYRQHQAPNLRHSPTDTARLFFVANCGFIL